MLNGGFMKEEKLKEVIEEAVEDAVEEVVEAIEASHDKEEKSEKVLPPLTPEKSKLPKVNEELFMKGDTLELAGVPFEIAEVHGIKLVLKRTDIR